MFRALYINKFYITLTVLIILSTAAHGVESTTEEQIYAQAIADAQRDAQLAVNQLTWQLTGCVGNFVGMGAALVYEPPLPAKRLLGKSPEYIEYYTNEFRRETQGLQVYHAATGCAMFVLGASLWWLL